MRHDIYMNRAIELAKKASGMTSPNPLVGAVITIGNEIIGEGYHQAFGGPHAEVNAVNSVADPSLLNKATIYVTLEPCSHYGKTPPCAELLVQHSFKEVVICNTDPNPLVAGRGIQLLEKNGIQVTTGILAEKGEWLNKRFFTAHRKKRPYIILKWAQNQNGFLDRLRASKETGINWITSPELKTLTHTWRAQEDAILVGANTLLNDAPSLNTRHAAGKHPLRVGIDLNSKISEHHSFWKSDSKTLRVSLKELNLPPIIDQFTITSKEHVLPELLGHLHQRSVTSLMVEGGAKTIEHFISENLWDEARILTAHNPWTEGLKAPSAEGIEKASFTIGQNHIKIIQNPCSI